MQRIIIHDDVSSIYVLVGEYLALWRTCHAILAPIVFRCHMAIFSEHLLGERNALCLDEKLHRRNESIKYHYTHIF